MGREAGESGVWNAGGTPMPDPLLSPEMHREAQGRGARGWAQGTSHYTASLGRSLEATESKPHPLSVQMGK